MVSLLLSFCLVVLETCLPCSGTISLGPRDVGTLANMVKRRALLLCVNKGMTEDQVEHILGRHTSCICYGLLSPSNGGYLCYYGRYEVVVNFRIDRTVTHWSYIREEAR
jgi:hypothetical protein